MAACERRGTPVQKMIGVGPFVLMKQYKCFSVLPPDVTKTSFKVENLHVEES